MTMAYQCPRAQYVPIFKPGTREMLGMFDRLRGIFVIQERRIKYVIDLGAVGDAPFEAAIAGEPPKGREA